MQRACRILYYYAYMNVKQASLYLMVGLYVSAGINHFWHPETYLKIIPDFLPAHKMINYATGVLEILVAVFLIPKATRHIAAWGLIVLLVLVFPANIQMAIDYKNDSHPNLWVAYLRLPLQLLLIWWAFLFTHSYRSRG